MNRTITPDAWKSLSQSLMVEEAALRAVAAVESSGSGFLALPSDLPKVLFEGHAFHRLTQGRFDAVEPTLSFPKWTREHYSGSASGEWKRLERAKGLDRASALQSASWGMFQIMGFNYALCGYTEVNAFVSAQCSGADGQLESFTRFIARDVFLSALRRRDWAKFASMYNGPAFAKNQYDKKLADAYSAFSALQPAGVAGAAGTRRRASRKAVAFTKHLKPKARPAQGRPEFAAIRAPRRQPRRRTVKPDPVDLRDLVYRPVRLDRAARVADAGQAAASDRSGQHAGLHGLLAGHVHRIPAGSRQAPRSSRCPATCCTAWQGATTSGPTTTIATRAPRCAARSRAGRGTAPLPFACGER